MDNYELSFQSLPYNLKSARRKKRLQKEDFDKQLIQIIRKRKLQWKQRLDLPMVPLENPYQKGWKRHFVLREDIKRSPSAAFYVQLLEKINTVQYHTEKSFKLKKKRKRRKAPLERRQFLQDFSEWQWHHHSLKLTEIDKAHFHLYEQISKNGKEKLRRYRFNEPWRYVLQVKPHFITEVKMLDQKLEQEIQLLENRIDHQHLNPRIHKLTGGRNVYQRWRKINNRSDRNLLYKTALTSFLEECEHNKQEQY